MWAVVAAAVAVAASPLPVTAAASPLPIPTAKQLEWQDNEIMALIHFNMATFLESLLM